MFRFRLQRVLELREEKEKAEGILLVEAERAAAVVRAERDTLQELQTASRATLSSAQTAAPTIGHLHHLGFVLNALDVRLEQATAAVVESDGCVAVARTALEAAARERRVMDRLKDKHEQAYREVETQRDRVLMDEVAMGRFMRIRAAEQTAGAESDDPAADDGSEGSLSTNGVDG